MISTLPIKLFSTMMEVQWMNKPFGIGIFLQLRRREAGGYDPVRTERLMSRGIGKDKMTVYGDFVIWRTSKRKEQWNGEQRC
jgi:hypothetical protein